jgi:hypothetical protein
VANAFYSKTQAATAPSPSSHLKETNQDLIAAANTLLMPGTIVNTTKYTCMKHGPQHTKKKA